MIARVVFAALVALGFIVHQAAAADLPTLLVAASF